MAETKAFQIVKAIKSRLEAIKSADGFNTDPEIALGIQFVNPDQLDASPVISVYEIGDEGPEDENMCGTMLINLQIMIEAHIRLEQDSSAEKLNLLWQDIIRSTCLADTTLGGLTASLNRGQRRYEYPSEGGGTVAVQQMLSARYLETYGNP